MFSRDGPGWSSAPGTDSGTSQQGTKWMEVDMYTAMYATVSNSAVTSQYTPVFF